MRWLRCTGGPFPPARSRLRLRRPACMLQPPARAVPYADLPRLPVGLVDPWNKGVRRHTDSRFESAFLTALLLENTLVQREEALQESACCQR